MNLELLKTALEKHWRFPSSRGPLNIEEVYSLPLTGNRGLNLDEIAIEVNAELEKRRLERALSPNLRTRKLQPLTPSLKSLRIESQSLS